MSSDVEKLNLLFNKALVYAKDECKLRDSWFEIKAFYEQSIDQARREGRIEGFEASREVDKSNVVGWLDNPGYRCLYLTVDDYLKSKEQHGK